MYISDHFDRIKRKYKLEFLLSATAFIFLLIAGVFLFIDSFRPQQTTIHVDKVTNQTTPSSKNSIIRIDVSGSVTHPGVYAVPAGTILYEVIDIAGGLSFDADKTFIARNFNHSLQVEDRQKIHFPSLHETTNNIFLEEPRILTYLENKNEDNTHVSTHISSKIPLNSADQSTLETLPGIGEKTAEKIIKNRPFKSIEELTAKKIVSSNKLQEISELISLE